MNYKLLAEAVRFELTASFPTSVFKTGALNRSATPPVFLLLNSWLPRLDLNQRPPD